MKIEEHWWKILVAVFVGVLALATYFARNTLEDIQNQNAKQWQHAAQIRDSLRDEISKVKERLAHLEGYHDREKEKVK